MSAFESKKYMWREGFKYKKPAEIVGSVLERIEERDGEVTAESFLDESRPEEAETHDMFEWNDSIAAEKFRLSQSQRILSQLAYEVIMEPERKIDVEIVEHKPEVDNPFKNIYVRSAFINVNRKGRVNSKARYISFESAMSHDDMKKQVISNALEELEMYTVKHSEITELSDLFSIILDGIKEAREKYVS